MKRKFYKKVKFKDKESKKYLRDTIFYWAKKHENGKRKFRYITNYVSHATRNSEKFILHVSYPITISGMSLSDICIEDAQQNVFHIALMSDRIIYFEREEGKIEIFGAKTPYKSGGGTFYSKQVSYTIEE